MPLPQSVKAKDILDWFAALAIPVCDDEALINRKFEGLKARYTADLNKPGDASRVARDWFKHVNLLQKERAAALDLVYTGMYQVTADLTIALAVGSGATVLTSQVRDGLLDVARKQCSTDDALAHRYVDRFIKDRNFTGGSLPRIQPASIANFIVTPKLGRIQLAWDWPANNCKDIRVIREEVIGRKNRKESVFTHGITQHADTDLVPGVWYQYKACARLPDHNGVDIYGSESESRAPAMAEVEQLNAAVQAAGGILLSWRPPASDVTVHIFQSYSGAPAIRTTADGPEAIAPARRLGVTGASTYADNDVKEGTVSHYRLVADFGREVYTEGKVVSVTVPVPPLPPREVMATYRFNADKDEVTISWKSVAGRGEAYTVVRRNGATPPTREDDGQVVLNKGAQEQFTDATASSGTCYTYAVFTYSGSMRSRSATASTPVVVRSDVTGLQAMAGNSRVELKWNSPAKFEKVIVRRRHDGLPRHVNDGLDVPVMARGSARDEPLRNGLRHSYLICCAYLGPDGRSLVYSEGKTIEAVPDVNPEPGQNLRVEVKGSEIWCVWDAARVGHDFIRRSASPPTMVEGVLFPQGGLPAGQSSGQSTSLAQ